MKRFAARFGIALVVCTAGAGLSLVTGTSGAATGPAFSPNSWSVLYDFVSVGQTATKSVIVTNSGDAAERFQNVTVGGPHVNDFHIASDGCSGRSLAPKATCTVSVTFQPTANGTRAATLKFSDDTSCANWIWLAGSADEPEMGARAKVASCSTSTTTIVTNTTTTVTTPAPPNQAASVDLPPARLCSSRRSFTVHVHAPKGDPIKQISARLNGQFLRVFKGADSSTVNLRGLPRGRFTLVIRASTSSGKTISQTRHYVTCVADKSK